MLKTLRAATAVLFISTMGAQAGTLWVVGDVDALGDDSDGLVGEMLAGAPDIASLIGNTASLDIGGFLGRPGVSSTGLATLSAGTLAGFEMLALGAQSRFNSGPLNLSPGETNAVGQYLSGGGNVLLQVETTSTSDYINYNAFLTAIGSTIQFTGNRAGILENFGTLFQCNACNTFSGGDDTRATFVGGTYDGQLAFAAEDIGGMAPVPVPAALPMLMAGLAGLGYLSRRRA